MQVVGAGVQEYDVRMHRERGPGDRRDLGYGEAGVPFVVVVGHAAGALRPDEEEVGAGEVGGEFEAVAVRARGAVPAVGDGVAEGEDAEFGAGGDGGAGGDVEAGGEGVVWGGVSGGVVVLGFGGRWAGGDW